MSGSSRASQTYTRCVVQLDAGISISWLPDPNGSYEGGQRHHQEEEARFLARLQHATAGIEVLFDELEEAGHVFTAPGRKGFTKGQDGAYGMVEMCQVHLRCEPPLTEPALAALAERISALLVLPPEPEEPAPARAPKSKWKFW